MAMIPNGVYITSWRNYASWAQDYLDTGDLMSRETAQDHLRSIRALRGHYSDSDISDMRIELSQNNADKDVLDAFNGFEQRWEELIK